MVVHSAMASNTCCLYWVIRNISLKLLLCRYEVKKPALSLWTACSIITAVRLPTVVWQWSLPEIRLGMPYKHCRYWANLVQIMLLPGLPHIMPIPLLLTLPIASHALKLYSIVGVCKVVRKKLSSASCRRIRMWRISFLKKVLGYWRPLQKLSSKLVLLHCSISITWQIII